MAKVHLVMQGKGGVGKTFISAMLAQYLQDQKRQLLCFDTDPVNSSFWGFQSIKAERVPLLEDDAIQPRRFDDLIDRINGCKGDLVIDNGASSFVALAQYLTHQDVPTLLEELGHQLFVHTVITGGQAFADTAENLNVMTRSFAPSAKFVVWLNPFFGPVQVLGKDFADMKIYADCADRISGLITLPNWQKETIGRDVSDMLSERLTFAEALADSRRSIMVRQRLKVARQQVFDRLKIVPIL